MKAPLFTYLVTTYGRDALALKAVRSCLADDPGPEAEVLLLDDCSPGPSFARLKAALKGTARLRLVRHPRNLGLVANWNRGLRLAHGRYVAVLGDDDQVLPGFRAAHLNVLRQSGLALSFSAIQVVDLDGRRQLTQRPLGFGDRTLSPMELWAWCAYYFSPIPMCAAVMERKALLRAGAFDPNAWHAADGDAFLRLAAQGGAAYLAKPLALNGYHRGQLQHGMRGPAMERALRAVAQRVPAPPWKGLAKDWRGRLSKLLLARDYLSSGLSSAAGPERDALIGKAVAAAEASGLPLPRTAFRAAAVSRGPWGAPMRTLFRAQRASRRRFAWPLRSPQACVAVMRKVLDA